MPMALKWPFGKKGAEPRQAKIPKKRRVVEYERKPDRSAEETMADRSHLDDKGFKAAMALLGVEPKKK